MYRPTGSSGGSSQQQPSPNAPRSVAPAFTGYVASTVARSTVTSNLSPAYPRMSFDAPSSTSYSPGNAGAASLVRRPSMLSDFHSIGVDTGIQQQEQRPSMITPQLIASAARPSMIDHQRRHQSMPGTSAYHPQVENISPTPDDQPPVNTSTSKPIVDKLEKVEREIKSVESRIKHCEKQQTQLEMHSNPNQADGSDATSSADADDVTDETENESGPGGVEALIARIYAENRRKAALSHAELERWPQIGAPDKYVVPLYADPNDAPGIRELHERHATFRPILIEFIRKQNQAQDLRIRYLSARYDTLRAVWLKRVERWENKPAKRAKDDKYREIFERTFLELKKQREERERDYRVARTTTSISGETTQQTSTQADELRKMRQQAVIPPTLLDIRTRQRLRYDNRNGLVRDPLADHRRRQEEADYRWTPHERSTFLDKIAMYGKNFGAIAMYLDRKTTKDCVKYYYATKKRENYKQILKRQYRKRAKVYRPPEMPRMIDVTRSVVDVVVKHDITAAEQHFCILCRTAIDPATNPGRVLTRACYEAYGLDAEQCHLNATDVRVCHTCRNGGNSVGGGGPTALLGGGQSGAFQSSSTSSGGGGPNGGVSATRRKYTFCPVGVCMQVSSPVTTTSSALTASSAAQLASAMSTVKRARPKPTRPLPGKIKLLTEQQRTNMYAILQMPLDTSKTCTLCYKRIMTHLESVLDGDDSDNQRTHKQQRNITESQQPSATLSVDGKASGVSDESSMSMSVDMSSWTDALDTKLRHLLIGDDHAAMAHAGYDWTPIADTLGRPPDACRTRWLHLSQSNASSSAASDMLLHPSASIQVVIKQSSVAASAIEQVAVPSQPPASTGIAGIESEEDDTSDLGGMEEELRSPSAVAPVFPVTTASGGYVDGADKDANEVKPMVVKVTEPIDADADTLIARAVLQVTDESIDDAVDRHFADSLLPKPRHIRTISVRSNESCATLSADEGQEPMDTDSTRPAASKVYKPKFHVSPPPPTTANECERNMQAIHLSDTHESSTHAAAPVLTKLPPQNPQPPVLAQAMRVSSSAALLSSSPPVQIIGAHRPQVVGPTTALARGSLTLGTPVVRSSATSSLMPTSAGRPASQRPAGGASTALTTIQQSRIVGQTSSSVSPAVLRTSAQQLSRQSTPTTATAGVTPNINTTTLQPTVDSSVNTLLLLAQQQYTLARQMGYSDADATFVFQQYLQQLLQTQQQQQRIGQSPTSAALQQHIAATNQQAAQLQQQRPSSSATTASVADYAANLLAMAQALNIPLEMLNQPELLKQLHIEHQRQQQQEAMTQALHVQQDRRILAESQRAMLLQEQRNINAAVACDQHLKDESQRLLLEHEMSRLIQGLGATMNVQHQQQIAVALNTLQQQHSALSQRTAAISSSSSSAAAAVGAYVQQQQMLQQYQQLQQQHGKLPLAGESQVAARSIVHGTAGSAVAAAPVGVYQQPSTSVVQQQQLQRAQINARQAACEPSSSAQIMISKGAMKQAQMASPVSNVLPMSNPSWIEQSAMVALRPSVPAGAAPSAAAATTTVPVTQAPNSNATAWLDTFISTSVMRQQQQQPQRLQAGTIKNPPDITVVPTSPFGHPINSTTSSFQPRQGTPTSASGGARSSMRPMTVDYEEVSPVQSPKPAAAGFDGVEQSAADKGNPVANVPAASGPRADSAAPSDTSQPPIVYNVFNLPPESLTSTTSPAAVQRGTPNITSAAVPPRATSTIVDAADRPRTSTMPSNTADYDEISDNEC